jgi:hypothetical protein
VANKFTDAVFYMPRMKGTNKAVLAALAGFADNDTGECWPSVGTLAIKTGFSTATVKRALRILRKADIISVAAQRETKNGYVNVHRINLDAVLKWGPGSSSTGVKENGGQGEMGTGVTETWGGGVK